MEGIVFMKTKFKEAGMAFKCFHNRGHPERWSPKDPSDFNAPERVAVLSDEIAERVGTHMTEPQEVPYIPARKRWTVSYRGGEIVKPWSEYTTTKSTETQLATVLLKRQQKRHHGTS